MAALIVLWLLPVDMLLALALSLALVMSMLVALRGACLLDPGSVVQVNVHGGQVRLRLRSGRVADASLQSLFASRYFLVMGFRHGTGRSFLVIGCDTTDPDEFRRLRVLFRLRGSRMLSPGFGSAE